MPAHSRRQHPCQRWQTRRTRLKFGRLRTLPLIKQGTVAQDGFAEIFEKLDLPFV